MLDDSDKPLDVRLRKRWRERMRIWGRQEQQQYDEPSPEDFAPTPRLPPTGFEKMPAPGSAWIGNCMLAVMLAGSVIHWSWKQSGPSPMTASGKAVFADGEYWRLFTALFGHGDLMHLLHNAPIYWFFALILNAYFGWFAAGVLALLIGVVSNAVTIWFYDPRVQLLGASGMVYGMVALWLVLYIRFDHKGWWVKRVMRSLGFSLLVLFPQTYEANVSYLAHASGFVTGIVAGIAWMPWAKKYAPVFRDETVVTDDAVQSDEKA